MSSRRGRSDPSIGLRWVVVFLAVGSFGIGGHRCQAATESEAAAKLSAILFPPTAGWTVLDQAPALSAARFAEVREHLRTAYVSSHVEACADPGCSLIDRVLERGDLKRFRVLDLDADGFPDIVYSGPSECAEGDTTVVWFGNKSGPGEPVRVVRWNVLLLRVAPAHEPAVSSVKIGCCADPVDEYYVGTLGNVYRHGAIRTAKDTRAPRDVVRLPVRFTNHRETVLRSSLQRSEQYDADLSGLLDTAVFGNVLCKYMAGVAGEVRAEERDSRGSTWVFVVMDGDSRALRHHNPFNVDAGWVERSTIR